MIDTMNSPEPVCGLDVALAVMGGKWKPLILYHLQGSPQRFGELKRRVAGVSEKVLIQQLRELVAAGVLTRRDHQRVPPMVDYMMTPFGLTLAAALMPLCAWGNEHRAEVEGTARSPSSSREKKLRDPRACPPVIHTGGCEPEAGKHCDPTDAATGRSR